MVLVQREDATEILTKYRWRRIMQEPRISLRRLLQPRGRLDSLKASEKLWLLCVEYKALLAKVHSVREEKKEEKEGAAWIQNQKLYKVYEYHFTKKYMYHHNQASHVRMSSREHKKQLKPKTQDKIKYLLSTFQKSHIKCTHRPSG